MKNLWKVFGPKAEQIIGTPEADLGRAEMLEQTGCVAAVKDVSFDVAPGEVFVVMGLSGSGKSTLVRCLTRLIEPTAGQGRDRRPRRRRDVDQGADGGTPQRGRDGVPALRPAAAPPGDGQRRLRAGDPRRGQGASATQRSQKVIELVGLKGYENHYPDQLSGGMQQRVGLARALAVGPKLLLFDEPFSALDPLIRRDMQNEVIRLQEDLDTTMVFITHDLQEALKLGDRILIMRDGEVVQIGRPDEVIGVAGGRLHPGLRPGGAALPRPHAALGDAAAASRRQPGRSRDGRRHGGAERGPCRPRLRPPGPRDENGELVGLVDDEAILRVVVAEEELPGQGQS